MRLLRSQFISLVGPRPVVFSIAAVIVAVLVGVFAVEFASSEATSRRQAERSFAVQARVTAELTSSLFTSSSSATAAEAAKSFGGQRPSAAALTALAKRSHLVYVLILDSEGRLLRASASAPTIVRNRRARGMSHIRAALARQAWFSNLLPSSRGNGRVIEWAFPFQTRYGKRVEVEAFDAKILSGFLRGILASPRKREARSATSSTRAAS